jgi:1-acyl-sn-glycerol-3-phosphate acyltransferase
LRKWPGPLSDWLGPREQYASRVAEPRRPTSRHGLSPDSPLLGHGPQGTEGYDHQTGVLDLPAPPRQDEPVDLRELRELVPSADPGREIDDWGRSQRIFDLVEPLLDFYYRYWFRVEVEGIENVPSDGGALIVSNHSGALPPDAPMIMQALRHEHPHPRPLYMLGEDWFKGYPGVGLLANKIGLVGAHPANAQRLLRDEGKLVLVFPEGQKGSRKLFWQRYRLRRFGRGGFVRTAMRAGVPIVPTAVIGAEEAMPIFAHVPLLQRLTGLIYFPINHAFPHFGPAAAAMYLPAKFRMRFLEPINMSRYAPEDADDIALVGRLSERIRLRIQEELDDLLLTRKSVWFG